MLFTIRVGKVEVSTDDEDAAIRIARRLERDGDAPAAEEAGGKKEGPRDTQRPPADPSVTSWAKFDRALNDNQRRTLVAIKANEGIALSDLAEGVARGSVSAASGYLTGIKRHAKGAGLRLSLVLKRDEQGTPPNRTIRYYAGRLTQANDISGG